MRDSNDLKAFKEQRGREAQDVDEADVYPIRYPGSCRSQGDSRDPLTDYKLLPIPKPPPPLTIDSWFDQTGIASITRCGGERSLVVTTGSIDRILWNRIQIESLVCWACGRRVRVSCSSRRVHCHSSGIDSDI